MIIRSIRAENFMKFSSLNLSGLPARGIVGIEGPNESGKTTIGEVILFAFFGKTRTTLETSVSRLIHWGTDYLSVEVEFSVPERGDFLIYREIDRYGTNFVKVVHLATRSEVAAGNVKVSEFLSRVLKFDFFEFHQSFYHDQRQFGMSPESQTEFMGRMTGIAQIEESVQAIRKEIGQLEREFSHYQKDTQRNLHQMEKYERNASKLPDLRELNRVRVEEVERVLSGQRRLQEECDACKQLAEKLQRPGRRLEQLAGEPVESALGALDEIHRELSGLSSGSAVEREFAGKGESDLRNQVQQIAEVREMLKSYQSMRGVYGELAGQLGKRLDPGDTSSLVAEGDRIRRELSRISERRRRALLLSGLMLVLALATAGAGGCLGNLHWTRWPALGSAVLSLLFLMSTVALVLLRIRLTRRMCDLQADADENSTLVKENRGELNRVNSLLQISGPGEAVRFIRDAGSVCNEDCTGLRQDFLDKFGKYCDPAEAEGNGGYRKAYQALSRMQRELRARALREVGRVERLIQDGEGALKKARSDLEKVENEIRECEAQAAKKEALAKKNGELESHSSGIRDEIDLRRMSIELLEDATASIRNKVGPSLSRFMRQVLPRLTTGRYRDIKVASDLSLQVFTSDKGDFLERSELSGGTQETLSLALRLAASQAFIASRTRQPQFVFLDEPFKMMDETRASECLEILSSLSSDIQQFFVIQPAFSPAQREKFIYSVRTEVDLLQLTLDPAGNGKGEAAANPPESADQEA